MVTPQAAYVTLHPDRPITRTIEVGDDAHVDLDAGGCVVGVETLDGSSWQSAIVTLVMTDRLRVT